MEDALTNSAKSASQSFAKIAQTQVASDIAQTLTFSMTAYSLDSLFQDLGPLPENPAKNDFNLLQVIDPVVFETLKADCPDLVDKLITLFLDTATPTFQILKASAETGNGQALASAAHLLKGSAANFGAERFVAICASIEEAGETGATPAVSQHLVGLLESEHRTLTKALLHPPYRQLE